MRKSSLVLMLAAVILLTTTGLGCKSKTTTDTNANTNVVVEPEDISVKIAINDGATTKTYTVAVPPNSSVDAIMEQANTENNLNYLTKESAGLGKFVDSIGGVATDANANKYWAYSVNGVPATTGVTETAVQSGDLITWEYTAFQ